jgi:flagellin
MAQVINTNVGALFAGAALNKSANALQVAQSRLSSGLRINSAKDDATGLSIATG